MVLKYLTSKRTWKTYLKQNSMGGNNYSETRIFYANDSYVTTNTGLGRIPGFGHLTYGVLIIDTYFPWKYHSSFS